MSSGLLKPAQSLKLPVKKKTNSKTQAKPGNPPSIGVTFCASLQNVKPCSSSETSVFLFTEDYGAAIQQNKALPKLCAVPALVQNQHHSGATGAGAAAGLGNLQSRETPKGACIGARAA